MRKGTTAFQNIGLLKECLAHGVVPDWNLLIGFPGEPEQVFEKYVRDLPKLVHLPPPGAPFMSDSIDTVRTSSTRQIMAWIFIQAISTD